MGYDERLMSNVLGGGFFFKRALCSALVVGSLGLASGCTDDTGDTVEIDLVAKVDGTDIFLGIVANDEKIVAYACDGKEQENPLGAWLVGENKNGNFSLSDYDLILEGEFDNDGNASGIFTTKDGAEHNFAASATVGDEGTYFSERDRVDGWVVIGDDVRGAVLNRGTDSNGIVLQEEVLVWTSLPLLAPFKEVFVLKEVVGEKPDPTDLEPLAVTKATILKFGFNQ
ncbi:MAG TPA: hypothetical protein ENK31_05105 [Nannocystis exedens]|nr:hypothetical protein [Nannocystis exedens]